MSPTSYLGIAAAGLLAGALLSAIEGEPGPDPAPPHPGLTFFAVEVTADYRNVSIDSEGVELGFVYRNDGSVTPR
jgi:hypothetical protein